MTIKAKTAQRSAYAQQKQHFCPEHDALCSPAMRMPGKRMRYFCPKGCEMSLRETVLK